jgi:Histone RNA hairpin-binding protein RNA-binding domain
MSSSAAADKNVAVSKTSKTATSKSGNTQVFGPLDPAQFQRRIEQRRRAVQHGKNTAGYYEYINQVPKNQRRPRSMKHPSTPDYTLDIPTKRWQGLVKAW